MLVKLVALAGAGLLLAGCASQNGEDLLTTGPLPAPACPTTPVTYALTIAPLLQQNCGGCHGGGLPAGGLNVSSYAQVKNVAANGQLLGTVGHEPGFAAMPQGGAKLSACAIGQLRQWVAAGSPNNYPSLPPLLCATSCYCWLLLGLLAARPAQEPAARYFTRTGTISFFSATPFEDIEARNQQVAAVEDLQTSQVAFTVPMKEFKFSKSLMQTHFNENYVESEKYPKATFTGHLVGFRGVALASAGPQPAQVEGDLTIHGATQHVRVPGTLERQGSRLLVQAKFVVAPADYRIEISALVRGHVAKTVTVALACDPLPL